MTTSVVTPDVPFVTFVCAKDVHYGKALIGSLKWRYPRSAVHVVADVDTPRSDMLQMSAIDGVVVHSVPELIRQHGFRFHGLLSKFNVFFLPGVDRAVVVDSDSVLLDDVLSKIDLSAVYGSLHGHDIDIADPVGRNAFGRWAVRLDAIGQLGGVMPAGPVRFVSGSHFYVNISLFPRELLTRLVPLLGLTHEHDGPLRAGDQGFWNFVANFEPSLRGKTWVRGLAWDADSESPRMQSSAALECLRDRSSRGAPFSFIHFVGRSRRLMLRSHAYGEVLASASDMYYGLVHRLGASEIDTVRRFCSIARRRVVSSLQR